MVKKKTAPKKLTLSKKEEIRNKFVQGIEDTRGGRKLFTIDELAADYGIPKPTLYKTAQREDWSLQQKRFQDKYLLELDARKRKELVEEAMNFDKTSLQLAKGVMGQIAQSLRQNTQGEDKIKPQTLNSLSQALVQCQKVGKLALGQATDNVNVETNAKESDTFREALGLLDNIAESKRKGDAESVH
tara:strand:- start:510 stop:1070 length:561 start_codon:yes stop_codon:yes gene_type:complete